MTGSDTVRLLDVERWTVRFRHGTVVADPTIMAALNVHDRIVETRIAYLGVEDSIAANIAALRARGAHAVADERGRAAFAVSGLSRPTLRDCAVQVTVVTGNAQDDDLGDVDGVVVVLDTDPAAEDRNRDWMSTIDALVVDRALPVVVQWHGAGTPEPEAVAAHHLRGWSSVCASTESGIDETFNQAVEAVMQSMTGPEQEDERPSANLRRGDGNPLLTALQRVLEQTAEAQASKLSESVTSRIEERMEARLHELTERLATVERSNRELASTVGRAATREDFATFSTAMTAAAEQRAAGEHEKLAAIESANDLFWRHLTTANDELLAAARHSCSREDLAAAVASVLSDLRRTAETLGTSRGKSATSEDLAALARDVADLRAQVATINAAVAALPTLDRVSESTVAAVRHGSARLGEQVRAADARVKALGENLERTLAAGAERNERIDVAVTGIVEEMKKPKKSWFG